MSLKGDLSTVGLAEVFQMISMSQKQGTLLVQDGESRKAIYFGKEGVSLLSTGKRKGFRIGDILCRYGKITAVQLDEVLQRQRESKRMLGEELIASGMVTEADIQEVVRSQIEEEIYDLFLWKRAAFEFIEGDPVQELQDPESKAIKLSFDLNGLLLEAVRRTDEWTRINQKIPSLEFIYTFVSGEAQLQESQAANDRVRSVARSIDGTTTVTDIVDQTLMPRFDICNILVDLMDRGRIRQLDVGEVVQIAKRRLEEGKREKGLALFQVAVAQAPDDVELLDSYAHALETEGLTQDAARSYLKVGNLLKEKGQSKDSVGYFQRAMALVPNDPQSKEALFEINMAGGNIEEALQAAMDIINGGLKSKDFTSARSVGEKAVAAAPQNLEVRLGLARIYHALMMKPERDEMVRFITKNLPVDQAAADRILIDLREISETSSAAKTQRAVVPVRKKASGGGGMKMAVVGAILVVAVVGAVIIYEMRAKRFYEGLVRQSQILEKGLQLDKAREVLAGFQNTAWRFSLTTKGRFRTDLEVLDKKIADAKAHAVSDVPPVEDEKTRIEREKREQLERDKKEAAELEDRINAQKTRGEMDDAQKSAARLIELAKKLNDPRRQKFAEAADRAINVYLKGALDLTVEYQTLESQGLYLKACEKIEELLRNYPFSEKARNATFPLALRVHPNGVKIMRGDKVIGESKGEDIIIRLAREEHVPFQLDFSKQGFKSQPIDVASVKQGILEVTLDEKEWTWRLPIGSELDAPPHLDGDLIYVRSREFIMAVTADKQNMRWKESLTGSGLPIRVLNDRLYVVSGRTLTILDPRLDSKNVVDHIELEDTIIGAPGFSTDGKTMYVGTANAFVVAIDLVKKTVTQRKMPKDVKAEPIERAGVLYVACTDGTLYAYKGDEEAWHASTGSVLDAAPVFGADIYIGAEDGKVYALDLATGVSKWTSQALGGPIDSALVLNGTTLYACTSNGTLHSLDMLGQEKWKYESKGPVHCSPAATGDAVFFGSEDKWFYALKAETGDLLWRYHTNKPIRTTPAVKDGMVYFGSDDQILYAVKVD